MDPRFEEAQMWFARVERENASAPKWYRRPLSKAGQVMTTVVSSLLIATVAYAAFVTTLRQHVVGSAAGAPNVVWLTGTANCNFIAGPGTCIPSSEGGDFTPRADISGFDNTSVLLVEGNAKNNGTSAVCITDLSSTDPLVTVSPNAGPFDGANALNPGAQTTVRVQYDFSGIASGYSADFFSDLEWSFGGSPCP
jgi:hypothetical protein